MVTSFYNNRIIKRIFSKIIVSIIKRIERLQIENGHLEINFRFISSSKIGYSSNDNNRSVKIQGIAVIS